MQIPIEELQERLITRSFEPSLSIGYFSENLLAGFILIGYRKINGKRIYYDIATGVIRSYQKKGVSNTLLRSLLQKMEDEKVDKFVLEVLVNNGLAQKLYERNGFRITRRLNSFEFEKVNLEPEQSLATSYQIDDEFLLNENLDEKAFNSFQPSWSNTFESFRNVSDKYQFRSISTQHGKILAYGIIHKTRGEIIQIGLNPSEQDPKFAIKIIQLLSKSTSAEKMVYVHVESGSKLESIIKQFGFTSTIDQYEMEYI